MQMFISMPGAHCTVGRYTDVGHRASAESSRQRDCKERPGISCAACRAARCRFPGRLRPAAMYRGCCHPCSRDQARGRQRSRCIPCSKRWTCTVRREHAIPAALARALGSCMALHTLLLSCAKAKSAQVCYEQHRAFQCGRSQISPAKARFNQQYQQLWPSSAQSLLPHISQSQ